MDHWEIERRSRGSDAFEMHSSLPAANSPSGHVYRRVDHSAQAGAAYEYRLVSVDVNGTRSVHADMIRAAERPFSGGEAPMSYYLSDNYPNPFNPATRIRFGLESAGQVTLAVYDVTGGLVAMLADGEYTAGEHTVAFQAHQHASGIFFYQITAGAFTQTKKMVLMK